MWGGISMAKRHDFSYFFHEGLSNMFSHGFMSFAAIGIGGLPADYGYLYPGGGKRQ